MLCSHAPADKHRLKLVSAKPFSSGVVLLTYQRS
jgi:hypothetical protein